MNRKPLGYIKPDTIHGVKVLHVQSKNLENAYKRYENVLIESFVGRRLKFGYVKDIVTNIWKLMNEFSMKPFVECMFSFEFKTMDEKQNVLDMVCFRIASNLFVIKPWHFFVQAKIEEMKTNPIWVIIKGMPM